MYQVILWATDGSENSDAALEHVKQLSEAGGSRVVAAHVKEMTVGRAAGYTARVDEEEIEQRIRNQVDELEASGMQIELRLASASAGGAAHALDDLAREVGADLIVVGTRGQGTVSGLLLGSVTHRLLHVAHCAVLAVPPPGRAAA
jgi:nucleotide-binding universal stress UspA family protein